MGCRLDCGGGLMDMIKFTKLYILSMYSLLNINYTAIKLKNVNV